MAVTVFPLLNAVIDYTGDVVSSANKQTNWGKDKGTDLSMSISEEDKEKAKKFIEERIKDKTRESIASIKARYLGSKEIAVRPFSNTNRGSLRVLAKKEGIPMRGQKKGDNKGLVKNQVEQKKNRGNTDCKLENEVERKKNRGNAERKPEKDSIITTKCCSSNTRTPNRKPLTSKENGGKRTDETEVMQV